MNISDGLRKNTVIGYFLEISRIPRGSGNEKAVSDYIKAFAVEQNLYYRQDDLHNIIVKKRAAIGYETCAPLILQAHLDMVCEKESGCFHDFLKDPICVYEDSGFLIAKGTTLGADNGIGVAYILAILADKSLFHPEIEAVFTVSEEIGLKGMSGLDVFDLKSKRLLNLDSEEEGVLYAACAGGVRVEMSLPLVFQNIDPRYAAYTLSVSGLKGGHSGLDIHLGRGNAITLLARAISLLSENFDMKVAAFTGGSKENAIPREASATVFVNPEDDFIPAVQNIEMIFKNEFADNEKNLSLKAETACHACEAVLCDETKEKLIAAILLTPNGVIYKSPFIEGLTETSNNLGTIRSEDGKALILNFIRSNTNSKKTEAVLNIERLAGLVGAEVSMRNDYDAWEFKADSMLRDTCLSVYEKLYGRKMEVSAIHGGLECALMGSKIPGIDMVSFGANITNVHTPGEKAEIESILTVYNYLCEVLKNLR